MRWLPGRFGNPETKISRGNLRKKKLREKKRRDVKAILILKKEF
jgi:hypothetical protein